jgi:hypothetical protein
MARVLAAEDEAWTDIEVKFIEHFVLIIDAMRSEGLWDDEDGFYYDVLHTPDGTTVPIRVRSIVGVLPLMTTVVLGPRILGPLGTLHKRFAAFRERLDPEGLAQGRGHILPGSGGDRLVLGVIPAGQGSRVLARVFDEDEFLSPFGLRALSRHHRDHPVWTDLGGVVVSVDYEPAESTTGMFGGNSNWRGPVWLPVNYLVIESLQRFHHYLGDGWTVEFPTGSGRLLNLWEVSAELSRRLVSLFTRDDGGRRPVHGDSALLQEDPHWDFPLFHEYFHGDTGRGLGASHQTGWTGLVAKLLQQSGAPRRERSRQAAAVGPGGAGVERGGGTVRGAAPRRSAAADSERMGRRETSSGAGMPEAGRRPGLDAPVVRSTDADRRTEQRGGRRRSDADRLATGGDAAGAGGRGAGPRLDDDAPAGRPR